MIMKRKMFVSGFLLIALILIAGAVYAAPDMPGAASGGWQCPGMGKGRMIHHGCGEGCPMAGQRTSCQQSLGQPVTQDQARQLVENRLQHWGNPNLKMGDFAEKDGFYEAAIVTKEGSLVQKVQIDKNTGWFRNVY
jgi:hypothetical protein